MFTVVLKTRKKSEAICNVGDLAAAAISRSFQSNGDKTNSSYDLVAKY